ncbi:MAG: hypothetical protein EOO65_04525 [Methanosarcinales archaeon]|nr:MAG: hypothetical protein EOO65_04525 [Methanosarcinales archaeon]
MVQSLTLLSNYYRLRMSYAHRASRAGDQDTATSVASVAPPGATARSFAASVTIPEPLLLCEATYNFGRAFHQLSLTHLACHFYDACLAIDVAHVDACMQAFNVQREAAHNFILLLERSNNVLKIDELIHKYLTYD